MNTYTKTTVHGTTKLEVVKKFVNKEDVGARSYWIVDVVAYNGAEETHRTSFHTYSEDIMEGVIFNG